MATTTITCGIFLYCNATKKFLVCHATNARWTQWSIPKGIPDAGEDEFAAASRELQEETDICIEDIRIKTVSPLLPSKYLKQNKELRSFLIVTDQSFENHSFKSALIPGKNIAEVDSWKWITLDEAARWIHESQAKRIEDIRRLLGQ
jgi:predicted NUDIX family NTP pyrophosphohydrolase